MPSRIFEHGSSKVTEEDVFLAEKELAERSLHEFARQAWHVLEPGMPFVDGRHIHAICEHLEACTRGELLKLLIAMPPRHMKSLLASVFWFCWTWISFPASRWLCLSYAQTLSTRDSKKCRDLLQSPWYQKRWGDRFKFAGDQNQKTRFENNHHGFRVASSVDGMATGEGGHFLTIDDSLSAKDATSKTKRQSVLDWYDGTMTTRGNDPKTTRVVVVGQRLHSQDLTGHLLSKDSGFEHLCLPGEFEPRRAYVTSIGKDWRTEPGELLWPERYGKEEMDNLRRNLGSYGFAGQIQQSPSPDDGSIFTTKSFRYFTVEPLRNEDGIQIDEVFTFEKSGVKKQVFASSCRWFQTCDTAMKTDQDNDYTAVSTVALTQENDLLVYDMFREKIEIPKQYQSLSEQRQRHPRVLFQAVEDKSSGTGLIQQARLEGKPFKILKAQGDKVARASTIAVMYENSQVYHRADAPWLYDLETELKQFPKGDHDDQVDTLAYAGILVMTGGILAMEANRPVTLAKVEDLDEEGQKSVAEFLKRYR